jgi:hypothetical protein
MVNSAIRWSGLLLISGAVLFEVALLFASTAPDTTGQLPPVTNVLLFLSSVLLLLSPIGPGRCTDDALAVD